MHDIIIIIVVVVGICAVKLRVMSASNCKTWILQVPAREPQITTSYFGFLCLLAVCINHWGLAREEVPPAQNTRLTFRRRRLLSPYRRESSRYKKR